METELQKLERNYSKARAEHNVTDVRFYIGEISNATPEQFAKEANLVMEAFLNGRTSEVDFGDSYN